MVAQRPFHNLNHLLETAARTASELTIDDWMEAFAAHPKIGDRRGSNWSKQEQSGTSSGSTQTLDELAQLNQKYLDQFGFIFIICATGKSADEMLAALRQRLGNTPAIELQQAATEQRLITQIRLRKLLGL